MGDWGYSNWDNWDDYNSNTRASNKSNNNRSGKSKSSRRSGKSKHSSKRSSKYYDDSDESESDNPNALCSCSFNQCLCLCNCCYCCCLLLFLSFYYISAKFCVSKPPLPKPAFYPLCLNLLKFCASERMSWKGAGAGWAPDANIRDPTDGTKTDSQNSLKPAPEPFGAAQEAAPAAAQTPATSQPWTHSRFKSISGPLQHFPPQTKLLEAYVPGQLIPILSLESRLKISRALKPDPDLQAYRDFVGAEFADGQTSKSGGLSGGSARKQPSMKDISQFSMVTFRKAVNKEREIKRRYGVLTSNKVEVVSSEEEVKKASENGEGEGGGLAALPKPKADAEALKHLEEESAFDSAGKKQVHTYKASKQGGVSSYSSSTSLSSSSSFLEKTKSKFKFKSKTKFTKRKVNLNAFKIGKFNPFLRVGPDSSEDSRYDAEFNRYNLTYESDGSNTFLQLNRFHDSSQSQAPLADQDQAELFLSFLKANGKCKNLLKQPFKTDDELNYDNIMGRRVANGEITVVDGPQGQGGGGSNVAAPEAQGQDAALASGSQAGSFVEMGETPESSISDNDNIGTTTSSPGYNTNLNLNYFNNFNLNEFRLYNDPGSSSLESRFCRDGPAVIDHPLLFPLRVFKPGFFSSLNMFSSSKDSDSDADSDSDSDNNHSTTSSSSFFQFQFPNTSSFLEKIGLSTQHEMIAEEQAAGDAGPQVINPNWNPGLQYDFDYDKLQPEPHKRPAVENQWPINPGSPQMEEGDLVHSAMSDFLRVLDQVLEKFKVSPEAQMGPRVDALGNPVGVGGRDLNQEANAAPAAPEGAAPAPETGSSSTLQISYRKYSISKVSESVSEGKKFNLNQKDDPPPPPDAAGTAGAQSDTELIPEPPLELTKEERVASVCYGLMAGHNRILMDDALSVERKESLRRMDMGELHVFIKAWEKGKEEMLKGVAFPKVNSGGG